MGSSVAWHLSHNQGFTGSILVVEVDPTYEWSSTARTNSCVRQQFSNEINVRISQYTAEVMGNFLFVNGFSGHGLQQSPAMGRGVAELIIHGEYRTLDLSPLGYHRVIHNTPFRERAII